MEARQWRKTLSQSPSLDEVLYGRERPMANNVTCAIIRPLLLEPQSVRN